MQQTFEWALCASYHVRYLAGAENFCMLQASNYLKSNKTQADTSIVTAMDVKLL